MKRRLAETPRLIRVGALSGIGEVLKRRGIDPNDVLADLGMHPDTLADDDLLMDPTELVTLLERCADVAQLSHFPLEVAATQDSTFLGTLGLLLQTAETIGEALNELSAYHHIHAQTSSWVLTTIEDEAVLEFHLEVPHMSARQRRLGVELALGQCCRGISNLSEAGIYPAHVNVHFSRGKSASHYERFFRSPVEWEAASDSLVYPLSVLDRRLARSNARFHEAIRSQLTRSDGIAESVVLVREVRTIIRSLLPTGQCNADRVSRCLGFDKRTLQRHLRRDAGTTYWALLDKVRFESVEHYLENSEFSLKQVSEVAGYSDPSNFASAFRKRYGCSPRQWRAKHAAHP